MKRTPASGSLRAFASSAARAIRLVVAHRRIADQVGERPLPSFCRQPAAADQRSQTFERSVPELRFTTIDAFRGAMMAVDAR
jgi:hypothetical protein